MTFFRVTNEVQGLKYELLVFVLLAQGEDIIINTGNALDGASFYFDLQI